jgi:chromate reductase
MASTFSIIGIVGSLRKGSYNRALMQAAVELAPPGVLIEPFEIAGIPVFSQDLESDPPAIVKELKGKIRKSDAVLFATPEYNRSIPGPLKNAIDWASRPMVDNAFDGKPAGIMGASTGMVGTSNAQWHLRQSCIFLNMHLVNRPEVLVSFAPEKISNGVVTDEKTRAKIAELVEALVKWGRRLNPEP